VIIRHADPERDAAQCAAIYAPYVTDGVASFEEVPPSADELGKRMERYIESYPWLVADDNGELAGYAYGSQHRTRAAYRWAADVTAYIAHDYQRRGLGSALYGALLALLREQGVQVACAGITLPNDASVGLHEACGFELVGVYSRIGFKQGAWWDVGWWELELIERSAGSPPEVVSPAQLPGPISV
jgi:phosphinothricin acetyltransferase